MGGRRTGIDAETLANIADEIVSVQREGVQIAIVIGGGNIFRGVTAATEGINRVAGDHMGMLATVINGLALQDALERRGANTRVNSAITMAEVAEPFIRRRAIRHLEKGRIVICAAGTGNPFFTTDSAAALRANELECEIIFKATKVDGIYTSDPEKDPTAKKIARLTYQRRRGGDRSGPRQQDPHLHFFAAGEGEHPEGAARREHRIDRDRRSGISEESMINDVIKDVTHRMHGAIEALHREFKTLRTGRANAAMLDGITVDYYGTPTPIGQVASLKVPESSLIVAEPWDKSMLGAVEKAVRNSDLGLNPSNDGKVIRIPIPQLTEERRKELVKRAHHIAEECRTAIRQVRRDGNDKLKKMLKGHEISEDDEKHGLDQIQKLTDKNIDEVGTVLEHKETDIMAV